jgi:putative glutathione S-transferase
MGLLVEGKWVDRWYDTKSKNGRFERKPSSFRNQIEEVSADDEHRYHLYVSLACPWAHRTLIVRALKGLEDAVSVSVVDPLMLAEGWVFGDAPGASADLINGFSHMHQVYTAADPRYTGRVTVPVLWDKQNATIVNNESSEIIRMFNRAFANVAKPGGAFAETDFYPEALRDEIDAINDRIYNTVNNGVYRAGFATTQQAYEEAVHELFASLDWLEARLADHRYLLGDRLTEADWRLFTTLVRFDAVYYGHFKCNLRRLSDYANLWGYTRELYQIDGVAETVNFDHIKRHYYYSHETINPTRVVPAGPLLDFDAPHDRGA